MHITAQSILSALGLLGFILAQDLTPDNIALPTDLLTDDKTVAKNVFHVKRPKCSQCYNYFLGKDRCVYSAGKASERCSPETGKPPGRQVPVDKPQVFKSHTQQSDQKLLAVTAAPDSIKVDVLKSEQRDSSTETPLPGKSLVRRYDSESDSFTLTSGTGVCGKYTDDEPGVCLWGTSQGEGAASGGWLNSTYTKACGRKVYIQRKGDTSGPTVYARVVDACDFYTKEPEPGCFRLAFTQHTFDELKPTPEEAKASTISGLIWDFANEHGEAPENAAP